MTVVEAIACQIQSTTCCIVTGERAEAPPARTRSPISYLRDIPGQITCRYRSIYANANKTRKHRCTADLTFSRTKSSSAPDRRLRSLRFPFVTSSNMLISTSTTRAIARSAAVLTGQRAALATVAGGQRSVKIVEVGPRDGLQNEKKVLETQLKIDLIDKLVGVGLRTVEAGSFVSPKWVSDGHDLYRVLSVLSIFGLLQVPQMASTQDILSSSVLRSLVDKHGSSLALPVLVPNAKGLSSLFSLLDSHASATPITDEIAVFVSASDGFSKANLNTTVAASLASLPPIIEQARARGIRVRGYVSVVLGCPFDGHVPPQQVASVVKALSDMGCYEVSLGDTIGVGTPSGWETLLGEVTKSVPVEKLAVSMRACLSCLRSEQVADEP